MIRRAIEIGSEMIPSADLVIKSTIRVGMGVAVMNVAPLAPAAAVHWVDFAGKFLIMLAAIGLVGHAEGVFAKHAAAKIRVEAARLGWWCVGLVLLAVSAVTLQAREPHEDDNGLG